MHARSVPRLLADNRTGLEGFPVGHVLEAPGIEARCVQRGVCQGSLSHPQERGDVGGHDDFRPMRQRNAAWVRIDLRPTRLGSGNGISVRGHLAHPAPQDEDRVGFLHSNSDACRRAEAGHAQVQRVVVREDVTAPPRGDHRDLHRLRETNQRVRAARAKHAGAGDDERPPGVQKQMHHLADEDRIRIGLVLDSNAGMRLAGHLEVQQILRHR